MIRSLMVLAAAVALTLTGTVGVASAEPGPPQACSYTLSPPHVVQVSGTDVVTATLASYISTGSGCASTGNPPRPVCQPAGPVTATL
jgi:hypothetical protein